MTAARTIEQITADVIRSGDRRALAGLRVLVADVGQATAARLISLDELPAGSQPGPARLAVRLFDHIVMRNPVTATAGQLADKLHATRAEILDALELLERNGQVVITVDGPEITARLSEGRTDG